MLYNASHIIAERVGSRPDDGSAARAAIVLLDRSPATAPPPGILPPPAPPPFLPVLQGPPAVLGALSVLPCSSGTFRR